MTCRYCHADSDEDGDVCSTCMAEILDEVQRELEWDDTSQGDPLAYGGRA